MADVPATADVVVIGAGIVGNSLVHHLARLGLEATSSRSTRAPLPNPGGSTGHASNFIFTVDHSREITDLTLDSVAQYKEMGVFTAVRRLRDRPHRGADGGAAPPDVAAPRRGASRPSWSRPEFVKEKVPFIEEDQFIGAFWTPGVGVVDSLRAGTIMRERALATGALTVVPTVEVIGLDTEDGPHGRRRITRVRTTGGDIEAETVVIAAGVWSPKIGDMAGISIPLTPAVHQMISVGPCPQLAGTEGEISFPIVRDMDTFCYERQHGADMEVGSYAHRAILHEPEDIPSIEQAKLSPTEMPFTEDDFDPQLEQAYELMPELLGAEGAEMRYAINGLLSLTCDGNPILGESEVDGPLDRRRGLDQGGPGRRSRGRRVDDPRPLRDRPAPQRHRPLPPRTRSAASTPGCAPPSRSSRPTGSSTRPSSTSPTATSGSRRCTTRRPKLGAVFFETAGWERPFWYESNAGLLEEYGDAVMPREHEWDSRWWSPIINAEHLRMREAAGGDRPVGVLHLRHRRARARSTPCRAPASRSATSRSARSSTRPVLDAKGGFRSDLTVMRLGDDHFRVVTGGAHGMADRAWFAGHLPEDGATTLTDLTDDVSTIGIWGPRARDILASLTSDDVSDERLRVPVLPRDRRSAASPSSPRGSPTSASSAGSSTSRWRRRPTCGRRCSRPARRTARCPAGIGVYGTTGRIEKGYRAYGAELDGERTHRRGRHAAAQGEGGRLRRQGGLPRPAGRGARRRCCAR